MGGPNCGPGATCKLSGIAVATRRRSRKGVQALAEPATPSGTRGRIKGCAEIALDRTCVVKTCLRRRNSWKTHRQLRSTNIRARSVVIFSQFTNNRTVSVDFDFVH